jgi:hypothetical protein
MLPACFNGYYGHVNIKPASPAKSRKQYPAPVFGTNRSRSVRDDDHTAVTDIDDAKRLPQLIINPAENCARPLHPVPQYAGRWAGDEVYLVGDYDESNLYETAQSEYHNIAEGLAKEYNEFIRLDDCRLSVK